MDSTELFFVALAVALVAVFVFRAVALWYWKVNLILEALQKIERHALIRTLVLAELHPKEHAAAESKRAEMLAEAAELRAAKYY